MTTDMTPLEIFEYKRAWISNNCYCVQVDIDSDVWGKDWCRKHIQRIDWSFDKYTKPDDSHTFKFRDLEVARNFLEEYKKFNPKFPTEVKS